MILENVEEFKTWGPLLENGKPDPVQKGRTFNSFVNALRRHGYQVETRELRACDFGTPTSRKRLVLIARCDGRPIVWPEPTHGDPKSEAVRAGRLKPWRTAAEIIDWSLPCPSIFASRREIKAQYGLNAVRPLADATQRRVAVGTDKFFIKSADPFIMAIGQTGFKSDRVKSKDEPLSTIVSKAEHCLVAPMLTKYHGPHIGEERRARGQALDNPVLTIDTSNRYGLVAASLVKYYGQGIGQHVGEPAHTITTKDREALISVHMLKLKGDNIGHSVNDPLQTITAGGLHYGVIKTRLVKAEPNADLQNWPQVRELLNKYCGYTIAGDEVLLLEINGEAWFIADIGMRMLTPRELFNAQGFPEDYIIELIQPNGKPYPKEEQVAKAGNAVCPPLAEALVRANLPEMCMSKTRHLQSNSNLIRSML